MGGRGRRRAAAQMVDLARCTTPTSTWVTPTPGLVTANHLQYLDSVLDLVERTEDWGDDARFRWNVEVNWPLELWLGEPGQGRSAPHARRGALRAVASAPSA